MHRDVLADSLSFEPLSPAAFLGRAAAAHGERIAVIDGSSRWTYHELHERVGRLAAVLAAAGEGRPVAVLAPNTHVMLEMTLGAPVAGVPLVALNTRLAADEISYMLEHSDAAALVCDPAYAELATEAARSLASPPRILHADSEYEEEIAASEPRPRVAVDELALLSVNYTSGTTGRPRGVMYHHRGAYLQALAMTSHLGLDPSTVYLWTLPMFHCNGWCLPWAVTAVGGTHVCLPRVDVSEIWRLVKDEGITHLSGAPTVLTMLAHADEAPAVAAERRAGGSPWLQVTTGGAPPSPAILERMDALGIDVTHLYGLTETFGPAMICDWRPEWADRDVAERARLKARQGVGNLISVPPRVLADDGTDVPPDGETIGEIALRGNNVMLGYLNDPAATAAAAPDGWFRTGDLGVMHPDGYIELRDRSKDVIISGGENITSIEVEQAIASHPDVLEVAVVAHPDERWGEVPVAYVTARAGATLTEDDIVAHVRARIARFKAPRAVYFGELPKTSTGKVQKFALRELGRNA